MEETRMTITRRLLGKMTLGLMAATAFGGASLAADMPKPFDDPGKVKIALAIIAAVIVIGVGLAIYASAKSKGS